MSASSSPRVVMAAVPSRIPEASMGGRSSKGMRFLLQVMFTRWSASSAAAPESPTLPTSTSITWLSVPPETIRIPAPASASASAPAFRTTWAA